MPPKSKANKREWNECVKCHSIVSYKDLSCHVAECTKLDSHLKLTHGHVFQGIFYGVISPYVKSLVSVPASCQDHLVLLHPSLMALCGLSVGKECIVNGNYSRIAWPSAEVPASSVKVTESFLKILELKLDMLVSVQPMRETPPKAGEVILSTSEWKEYYSKEEFEKYLCQKFCKRCLQVGNVIHLTYYGQNCEFVVSKIVQSKPSYVCDVEIDRVRGDSDLDLSYDMSNLNISNMSTDSDTSLLLQTSSPSITSPLSTPNKSTKSQTDDLSKGDHSSEILCDANVFRTPVVQRNCSSSVSDDIGFFRVSTGSKFSIVRPQNEEDNEIKETEVKVRFENVGGLTSQIKTLKELIYLPLKSPERLHLYGLSQPRGILLFGPSGTGKSMLLDAICNEIDIHVVTAFSSDIISKFYGESEANLRRIFESAEDRAPSLIVMDDIDSLFSKRESSQSEIHQRLVATLLTLMDGINKKSQKKFVMVLAATVNPDSLEPALRRPGRFDKEIEIGVPSPADRRDILVRTFSGIPNVISQTEVTTVADKTHGFVGADLKCLCQQATFCAFKRVSGNNENGSLSVTMEDVAIAMTMVKPSAMREVQLEVPKVYWSDIGGQEDIKMKLKQAVEWPLKHPEAFQRMGIKPPRGVLMYGPPGCSKTMIAKALATESGLNFIAVKGPELFSKWVGESERAVREVFRKARSAAPSIVFFDEIDALAVERGSSSGGGNVGDRVLAQLLTEIDGVEKLQDVTIVAATNRPDMIDKALMRPGRLDRILYVPLPDRNTREQIFTINFKKMPIGSDVSVESLVECTEKYSGAEIKAVCNEAAMFSLQEDINSAVVKRLHFDQALTVVTPRITNELITFYEEYKKKSGLHTI